MTPPPVLPTPAAPPTAPTSGPSGAVVGVGGTGLAGLLIYVDRLLAAQGVTGPGLMADLGPILTPLWANFPLLALLIVAAWVGARMWKKSQADRALAEAHAAVASEALRTEVAGVSTGLTGLRGEVHELRGALQQHAESTDARITAVQVEVAGVARRVDVLEKPTRKPTAKPPKR